MTSPGTLPQRPHRALRGVPSVVALTCAAVVASALAGGLVLRETAVGAAQDPTSCRPDNIALVNGGFEEPRAAKNGWTPHHRGERSGLGDHSD